MAFLTDLERDEYRQTVLDQWQAARERSWPRFAYERLVNRALVHLGRSDLKPDVVTDRLLPSLQKQMDILADDVDTARWLRNWLERKIQADFPSPPLVDGDDLMELGYRPGRELGAMKKRLNDLAAEGGYSREQLLDMAIRELARSSGPK